MRIDLRYFIDLVLQRAQAGLRAEASRGYLGVLWWVIEPGMYMGIFYILMAHLFNRGDENFIMFLLVGLIVWKWFGTTVSAAANSLMANSGLINQVYLPKIIFPLTAIVINTFKFLIILLLFLVFLQFLPAKPSWAWALLPVLIFSQLLLITAVGSLSAAIMPFFPDFRVIIDNVLMMLFFMSGIFFDIGQLPETVKGYLIINPMALLIMMYRKLLIEGALPDFQQIAWIMSFSLAILMLALWLFRRFDRVYPKVVF
jgi:lipopolysaccharide transport system permease protein